MVNNNPRAIFYNFITSLSMDFPVGNLNLPQQVPEIGILPVFYASSVTLL